MSTYTRHDGHLMQLLNFDNEKIISYSDHIALISSGYVISDLHVFLEFNNHPHQYYHHGWQSWSLAAWLPVDFKLPIQKPERLHPLQIDPLYAKHPAPNGSWLGAVRFDDGNILLLGALGLDSHVALHGNQLHGWYEAPRVGHNTGHGEWFVGYGNDSDVFKRYTELLGERLGSMPRSGAPHGVKPAPRVWCSWYSLYTSIDESKLHHITKELDDLPFDVLQIDDGWQISIGDWEANKKFPSGMQALAEKIRASGRTPGLWLAPLIADQSSDLFRQHPGWFLKDADEHFVSAGFNWGEQLYALDTTHPDALNWLTTLMRQVRTWGFDYLKLDFLYAGALPGVRHMDIPREAAYRHGLKAMREAMGEDAYLLTCGAPILPSIGLCDALRIGPDVAGEWESYRDAILLYNPTTPGTKNAIRTTVNRLWLSPLVATDPDVAYFRSQHISMDASQKQMLQDLAQVCNFKATSDPPGWLNAKEHDNLKSFLESTPNVQRTGKYTFTLDNREVDFSSVMPLPGLPTGTNSIMGTFLGWLGNQGWALKIMHSLGNQLLKNLLKQTPPN